MSRDGCVMTPGEKQLMDYIKEYTEEHGYPPDHREMAKHMNIKPGGGISRRLASLKDRGKVTYTPAKPRSVKVVDKEPFLEAAYEYARCPSLKGFHRLQDAFHECYG